MPTLLSPCVTPSSAPPALPHLAPPQIQVTAFQVWPAEKQGGAEGSFCYIANKKSQTVAKLSFLSDEGNLILL